MTDDSDFIELNQLIDAPEKLVEVALALGFQSLEELADSVADPELRRKLIQLAHSTPLKPTQSHLVSDQE